MFMMKMVLKLISKNSMKICNNQAKEFDLTFKKFDNAVLTHIAVFSS